MGVCATRRKFAQDLPGYPRDDRQTTVQRGRKSFSRSSLYDRMGIVTAARAVYPACKAIVVLLHSPTQAQHVVLTGRIHDRRKVDPALLERPA
jgi:hypothetical protein